MVSFACWAWPFEGDKLSTQPKARGTALPALAFWPLSQPYLITCPYWALNSPPCGADFEFCPRLVQCGVHLTAVLGPSIFASVGVFLCLLLHWLLNSSSSTLQRPVLLYNSYLLTYRAQLKLETTPSGDICGCWPIIHSPSFRWSYFVF